MYFLIKLFLVIFTVQHSSGFCDICVTLPLITTSVQCPICSQSANSLQNNSEKTSKSEEGNYSNNYYNWTTCFVQAPPCNASYKYRTSDGSCNNLKHPTWGMGSTAFSRILPAYYHDHKHQLALQTNGKPRPLTRILSTEVFSDRNNPDTVNLITMQWGQTIAHDVAISLPIAGKSIDCCNPNNIKNNNICLPIMVPKNDMFYSRYNVTCISEIRTNITLTGDNCNNGPAAQLNGNTHIIDASLTYGSDSDTARNLRELKGGRLKTQKTKDGRIFLPNVPSDQIESQCFVKTITEPCYTAGDVRVNQNTELTTLQVILIREHNRVAEKFAQIHPEWDDEILYQESRAVVIAEFQHITYKEWLILYLGDHNMKKFNLYPQTNGYTTYNSDINFMTFNEFATASYRIPHSGIQGTLRMFNYSRVEVNKVHIGDWMDRPKVIQKNDNYDQFLLGLTNQPMQIFEEYYSEQITQYLFHGFGPYGQDLLSLDIERGRDHGLAPYVYYLEVCTGFKPHTFKDLNRYISKKFLHKLKKYYNSIEDIDVIVGSILENKVPNTRFGPTALCINTDQFYRKKFGDRFWYEVGGQPNSFTKSQLREIKKASLSRLICDNSDNIKTITVNSFLPESKKNKIVDCRNIPEINLNKW